MKLHEKINTKILAITTAILLFLLADFVEAQTAAGVAHSHRATRRRTAVVVSSATHAQDEQAAAAQQEAPPPATEPAPAATTSTSAATSTPAPQSTSEQLPIGTVVSKLPDGCVSTSVDNIEYYQCGPNYYRAVFQENTLVYVTTDPPK